MQRTVPAPVVAAVVVVGGLVATACSTVSTPAPVEEAAPSPSSSRSRTLERWPALAAYCASDPDREPPTPLTIDVPTARSPEEAIAEYQPTVPRLVGVELVKVEQTTRWPFTATFVAELADGSIGAKVLVERIGDGDKRRWVVVTESYCTDLVHGGERRLRSTLALCALGYREEEPSEPEEPSETPVASNAWCPPNPGDSLDAK